MRSILRLIGRPFLEMLFTVEFRGTENVPSEGPVIIAANHPSYLDPVLISLPIKRVIRFMAWDALFRIPVLGALIRALGAFPVDIRRGRGEAAYQRALQVLESGQALGIFPEGQRSELGPMGELRYGTARLAIATGAPIVPVTIAGAFRAWPKRRLLPKPAQIVVHYQEPIKLDETERLEKGRQALFQQEVTDALATKINRRLEPSLRKDQALEAWYRQPPSHIRTYEAAPLAAALVTALIAGRRGLRIEVWLLPLAYYFYLAADLLLIRPSRLAKWLRNSMPIWLMMVWHHSLVGSLELPEGGLNGLLLALMLIVFFSFFWEDYFTLQKFVRGVVVIYYVSLALELAWPHDLAMFVAATSFCAAFAALHRTLRYRTLALAAIAVSALAVVASRAASPVLLVYVALAVLTLGYLRAFVNVAYDIRKSGVIRTDAS